jgi:hypothetical protein
MADSSSDFSRAEPLPFAPTHGTGGVASNILRDLGMINSLEEPLYYVEDFTEGIAAAGFKGSAGTGDQV